MCVHSGKHGMHSHGGPWEREGNHRKIPVSEPLVPTLLRGNECGMAKKKGSNLRRTNFEE